MARGRCAPGAEGCGEQAGEEAPPARRGLPRGVPARPRLSSEGEPLPRVVLVHNPQRAKKLLPLLEGVPVVLLAGWADLLRLMRGPRGQGAVMADTFGRWGLWGMAASLLLGEPLIIRLRGEFFREAREVAATGSGLGRWPRYFINTLVARCCLMRAQLVIFNSGYLARTMAPWAEGKEWAVVHNPYSPPRGHEAGRPLNLPSRGQGLNLLSVTNLNVFSKVEPIVRALDEWIAPALWEELDIHWTICGGGYHEQWLLAEVAKRGMAQRVHILGWVDGVKSFYEACDVFVHISRMDAFPNATMEAMMHGKPVITNPESCGTLEQVEHGRNGFVVGSGEEFAAALRAYAGDPGLRERHGAEGRRLVEERFCVATQRTRLHQALRQFLMRS